MLKARMWFARIVMVYAALIFSFLAYLYIFETMNNISRYGISLSGAPEAVNFIRIIAGSLFAGMALASLFGLMLPAYLKTGLGIIVLFNGCIVAGRVLGIALDGVSALQLTELRDEGISWLFFLASLLVLPDKTRVYNSCAGKQN